MGKGEGGEEDGSGVDSQYYIPIPIARYRFSHLLRVSPQTRIHAQRNQSAHLGEDLQARTSQGSQAT